MAGAKSHFARLGTNKVRYVTVGAGKPKIVFVHGWSCNGGFWKEQIPALADQAQLVLIDLPGHGQSDKPHVDYSMDFFADAVLAVMRDVRVAKAILVGHSMGTPIICRVYAKAPEKVAALVAVDGVLRRPQFQPGQAERLVARFSGPDYRDNVKSFVSAMFPIPGTEALRDRVLDEMLATPQSVMSSAMAAMFGANQPAWDLKSVDVPLLVINAKNPMWTAEYEAYARSLSKRSDYRVIEGAGHFLMLEKPIEFNGVLKEFLPKVDM